MIHSSRYVVTPISFLVQHQRRDIEDQTGLGRRYFHSGLSIREERRCTEALSLSCGVFLLFLLEFGDNTSCSNIFTIVGQLLLNCDNTLLKYNGSSFAKISTTSSFDFSPRLKICFVFFSSLCIWFLSDNDRIPPSKFSVSVISL